MVGKMMKEADASGTGVVLLDDFERVYAEAIAPHGGGRASIGSIMLSNLVDMGGSLPGAQGLTRRASGLFGDNGGGGLLELGSLSSMGIGFGGTDPSPAAAQAQLQSLDRDEVVYEAAISPSKKHTIDADAASRPLGSPLDGGDVESGGGGPQLSGGHYSHYAGMVSEGAGGKGAPKPALSSDQRKSATAGTKPPPPPGPQAEADKLAPPSEADLRRRADTQRLSVLEMEKKARAIFIRIDHDRSGYLDKEEVALALQEMGLQAAGEHVEDLIRRFDTDGDGQLDFEEFKTVCASTPIGHMDWVRRCRRRRRRRRWPQDPPLPRPTVRTTSTRIA